MKRILLLSFSGLVHAVLGYYFYYVLQVMLACFYLFGYYLGFKSGYNENGEESVLFTLILLLFLLVGIYATIIIFLNHSLSKNALIRRRYSLLINGFIF